MLKDGKLFGKINIIDFFVLIAIIILVVAAAVKLVSDDSEAVTNEDKQINVTIICRAVSEEAVEALKSGDKLVARGAFTTGEIVSVATTNAIVFAPDANGQMTASEHPVYKDAIINIKDSAKTNGAILTCAGQEVRIGYNFIVKTQIVEIHGEITEIEFTNN